MKQTLFSLLFVLLPMMSYAYDALIDGIYYNLNSSDMSAAVTFKSDDSYFGAINIPASVTYNNKTYSVTSIDDVAFAGCSNLTSVVLPNSIISIGTDAFSDCSNLVNIYIPDNVTYVGSNCFSNTPWYNNQQDGIVYIGKVAYKYKGTMPANTSINLNDGTISICTGAFYNCTNLVNVSIPNSVTTIGSNAFQGCSSLITISTLENITYVGSYAFHGTPWYNNQPNGVVYIGKVAYKYKGTMPSNTNITLNEGIVQISDHAFSECHNLSSIYIPNSVCIIGSYAFSYCTSLSSVSIPLGVTTIDDSSFYACSNLTSVTMSNGVTSIEHYAFHGCSKLSSITLSDNITYVEEHAFGGTPWFENQPDGLLYIGKVAFRYKGTMPTNTHIVLNDGTVEIANNVFYGCDGLTKIDIPNSVTNIGDYAFYKCSSITSLNIPNGVKSIGSHSFYGCNGLTSINIPHALTSIGVAAFQGCNNLTNLSIPDNVAFIGSSAFQNCSGLISIVIPESITSIEGSVFSGCSSLNSINIPEGVTSINGWAFSDCSSLANIVIPQSTTSIGKSAFYGCSSLTKINISSNMRTIGSDAFKNCYGLTRVVISDLTSWCNISFANEKSNPLYYAHHLFISEEEIQNLIIPNSITSIGSYTFQNANGFISLTIPNHITTIPESAFNGCSGLTSVTLPNQLSIIRANAFSDCYNLSSLTIPASVEYIYQNAFSGCTSLEVINAQPTTPPFLYDNSFSDFTIPVNVPSGCSSAYNTAQGWSNFTTINDGNVYYQLAITSDSHGKATYGGKDVRNTTTAFDMQEGSNAAITITADAGYQIATATVNDVDVMSSIVNGVLTLTNVTANAAIVLTFSRTSDHTTVTIGSTGMATYCPMDDVDFSTVSGLKAYTATGYDHGTLTVSRVLNAPAGTGLLLQGEAGSYDVPYATSTGYYINLLHGLMTDTQVLPTEGGYTNFILGQKSGVTTFYRLSEAGTVAAGKAYLQLPTSVVDDGSNSRVMRIVAEDETTGVRSVELLTNSEGVNSEELFDLQGRRVAKPSKGIYIVGGQKVVVK